MTEAVAGDDTGTTVRYVAVRTGRILTDRDQAERMPEPVLQWIRRDDGGEEIVCLRCGAVECPGCLAEGDEG